MWLKKYWGLLSDGQRITLSIVVTGLVLEVAAILTSNNYFTIVIEVIIGILCIGVGGYFVLDDLYKLLQRQRKDGAEQAREQILELIKSHGDRIFLEFERIYGQDWSTDRSNLSGMIVGMEKEIEEMSLEPIEKRK